MIEIIPSYLDEVRFIDVDGTEKIGNFIANFDKDLCEVICESKSYIVHLNDIELTYNPNKKTEDDLFNFKDLFSDIKDL